MKFQDNRNENKFAFTGDIIVIDKEDHFYFSEPYDEEDANMFFLTSLENGVTQTINLKDGEELKVNGYVSNLGTVTDIISNDKIMISFEK